MRRAIKLGLFLTVAVGGIIFFVLWRDLRATESVNALEEAGWGKSTSSHITYTYPNQCLQIRDFLNRLWFAHSGIVLPRGRPASLEKVMTYYMLSLAPRPGSFTVFYAPGVDWKRAQIEPVTKTNRGQINVASLPVRLFLPPTDMALFSSREM